MGVSSLTSAQGLVADVHSLRTTVRPRRGDSRVKTAAVLIAAGAVFALIVSMLPVTEGPRAKESDTSANDKHAYSYDFRVHALNQSSAVRNESGTVFKFKEADLPFAFSTICFGDYRADTTFSRIYYGGSGILMNAWGGRASIVLMETNGKLVNRIDYTGQAQVVFNGRAESVTYPTTTTTYNGTDQIVQDWRNGDWTPTDGVFVEHPGNITLSNASFFLMTLEPVVVTDIPEFDLAIPGAFCVLMVILLRRRNSAVQE